VRERSQSVAVLAPSCSSPSPFVSCRGEVALALRRVLDSYRAARYWALTAGAFFRAATHGAPLSSGVVFAALTAPPAAMATATAAIVTSSGASTRAAMSYLPYE